MKDFGWFIFPLLLAAVTPSITPSLLFVLPSLCPVPTTVEKRGFVISRFFFIYFSSYYWGKENGSLYRGLRYIEVPLYSNDTIAFSASLDRKKRGHNITGEKIETF